MQLLRLYSSTRPWSRDELHTYRQQRHKHCRSNYAFQREWAVRSLNERVCSNKLYWNVTVGRTICDARRMTEAAFLSDEWMVVPGGIHVYMHCCSDFCTGFNAFVDGVQPLFRRIYHKIKRMRSCEVYQAVSPFEVAVIAPGLERLQRYVEKGILDARKKAAALVSGGFGALCVFLGSWRGFARHGRRE